jgi:hypothetical protein
MRAILLLLSLAITGCAGRFEVNSVVPARSEVLRDVEGYAMASCLSHQTDPYLKDQGDAWASVIVQRMKGNVDVLAAIVEKVKRENAKENAAVIRNESGKEKDKMLPILHCAEIIDNPFVRAEIQKAVIGLGPSYRQ